MRLSGKTALITGGATGIGLGTAIALAQEGCRVAIAGRREDKLREAAASFKGEPPFIYRAADVGDLKSVESLVAWATKELGHLDIVVNSAGVNVLRR
ncbi:MAG TPA: SDR family NAD(P)-dependent oxidoreductase, partial [Pirellulales bacterium]|nr:SDR family NAD(P)-dependent oxidoreductase [Pirellulales bacterium]